MGSLDRTFVFAAASLCAASALLVPASAAAQSERELLQMARDRMETGQEAFLGERFEEAAAAFLSAYEARPFSAFLYNAGVAYEELERAAEAVEQYRAYLEAEPDAADREDVEARIARLGGSTTVPDTNPDGTNPDGTNPDGTNPDGTNPDGTNPDNTNPDGTNPDGTNPDGTNPDGTNPDGTNPDGTNPERPHRPAAAMKSLLSVETNPPDATIILRREGQEITRGQSPFAETLDPGEYEISVEHPDFRTVARSMRIRAGKVYVAILELSQGEFLGLLRVVTDPPGASVYIDDREQGAIGQTPFQNVVATGEHHIWIERPGYEVEERTVEIEIGDDVSHELTLERVTYGRIRVIGNSPGARVLVDGVEVGTVPYDGQVEAGPHRITVQRDGMKDWEEQVDVQRGQLTPIRVRLRPAVSRSGAWAMATVGLLSIGGGVALGLLGQGVRRDLANDRDAGTLASDDDRFLRGRIYTIAANGAFGLGALLGILSLYYFLRDPLPDSEGTTLEPRDWTLRPALDLRHRAGGATLDWRF